MGSTFSRTKQGEERSPAAAAPQGAATPQDDVVADGNLSKVTARQRNDTTSDAMREGSTELPPDMAHILQSGVYKDLEEQADGLARAPGQSIQDAVRDLKEKYKINSDMDNDKEEGELEDVRAELARREGDLKAALAAARARKAQKTAEDISSGPTAGKGDDSSSDESDASSSSAATSSSSGSSLGFGKQPSSKKRKAANQDPDSGDEDEEDSDEDGHTAPKGSKADVLSAASQFASKNEILDPTIPKLQIEKLPIHEEIRSFGTVESVIHNVVVIRADIRSGERLEGQVLDEGSLVCLENRRVLGPIFETFGAVSCPLYSIRLPADHPLRTFGPADAQHGESALPQIATGVSVYFPTNPAFSSLLFTHQIKLSQLKGSDASNLYDEEPGDNEVEFSDDEQEQEYRRLLKQRRKMRTYDGADAASAQDDAEYMFDGEDDEGLMQAPKEAGLEDEDSYGTDKTAHDHSAQAMQYTVTQAAVPNSPSRVSDSLPRTASNNRGGRPARGQGHRGRGGSSRGRGAEQPRRQAPAGNGLRGGTGRGRGRGRGSVRDSYEAPQAYTPRPPISHSLPQRPAFQHPDALPYDDPIVPSHGYASSASAGHQRSPSASLPTRPTQRTDEGYDPTSPNPSARSSHQALAWSPYNAAPAFNTSYASGFPSPAQTAFPAAMSFPNSSPYPPFQNNMTYAGPGHGQHRTPYAQYPQQGPPAGQPARSHNPHEYQVRPNYNM